MPGAVGETWTFAASSITRFGPSIIPGRGDRKNPSSGIPDPATTTRASESPLSRISEGRAFLFVHQRRAGNGRAPRDRQSAAGPVQDSSILCTI